MEKIISDLKESARILEEMLEDGDLKGDLLISRSYQGNIYLSDISNKLKRLTDNLMIAKVLEQTRRK